MPQSVSALHGDAAPKRQLKPQATLPHCYRLHRSWTTLRPRQSDASAPIPCPTLIKRPTIISSFTPALLRHGRILRTPQPAKGMQVPQDRCPQRHSLQPLCHRTHRAVSQLLVRQSAPFLRRVRPTPRDVRGRWPTGWSGVRRPRGPPLRRHARPHPDEIRGDEQRLQIMARVVHDRGRGRARPARARGARGVQDCRRGEEGAYAFAKLQGMRCVARIQRVPEWSPPFKRPGQYPQPRRADVVPCRRCDYLSL
ncbi:hypothetical protein FA95DRAFT_715915 [Auriscalpium vulgare]|uniref:Uncharacterized protein n=1 Tax=Auriscalpium vulgare TaxID=40419 RepID=A0ACB8RBJ5_9AGAM|nr:hypothetical protein FA95DRAFT_715915 [Auriscalpium vulgare]